MIKLSGEDMSEQREAEPTTPSASEYMNDKRAS